MLYLLARVSSRSHLHPDHHVDLRSTIMIFINWEYVIVVVCMITVLFFISLAAMEGSDILEWIGVILMFSLPAILVFEVLYIAYKTFTGGL